MKTMVLNASLLATALALALPATSQAREPNGAAGEQEVRIERRTKPAAPGSATEEVRVERRVMRRPVIGVLMTPDEEAGVRISGVTPDSPAAKAGIRSGDRLVSIGGTRILGSDGALRVENARKLLADGQAGEPVRLGYERAGRKATVDVTPKVDERVVVWQGGESGAAGEGPRVVRRVIRRDGEDTEELALPRGVAPTIHREVIRIATGDDCRGEPCDAPQLLSALRWNGLNLASVDAELGRYFGTSRGVLVLSTGDLEGLRAGDVIQSVDGKPVATPRDVMDALRGKPGSSRVAVSYMRDRKPAAAQVTVPKQLDALPPLPPPPQAPPAPPKPPKPPKPAPAPPSAAVDTATEAPSAVFALAVATPRYD
jgi:membrane-associated protease RseP (regulator of RpoE activity)